MPRREYTSTFKCAEAGCRESAFYVSTTRREQAETYASQQKHPFRCVRHSRPDDVLSVERPERTVEYIVSKRGELWKDKLFFHSDTDRWHGMLLDHGIRAFAKDFPEGTRLTVTARIEVPDADR
jgi:hypothetical protein